MPRTGLPLGTQLGRYEIRSKLGQGGMSDVYLAQDTKLDRKVALKTLPVEFAASPERMRRFVQEAKAASALNHPNIITIHEIDQIGSTPFMTTEFIDGETLRVSAEARPRQTRRSSRRRHTDRRRSFGGPRSGNRPSRH